MVLTCVLVHVGIDVDVKPKINRQGQMVYPRQRQTDGVLYTTHAPPSTQSKHTFRLAIKQCIQCNGKDKTIEVLRRQVRRILTKHEWKPVLWDYLNNDERRTTITSSMFLK